MKETKMHITKLKKPIWQIYILYDPNCEKAFQLWKSQNYGGSWKVSGYQVLDDREEWIHRAEYF